jgi:hypothetical protein
MNRIWRRLPRDLVTSVLRYMDIETRIAFKIIGKLPETDFKFEPKKILYTPYNYYVSNENIELRWNLPNSRHYLYSRTICPPHISEKIMHTIEVYNGIWTTIWSVFLL